MSQPGTAAGPSALRQKFGPRRGLAVSVGKATRWLSRHLGRGGGTALPGLLAEKIDPSMVAQLTRAIPRGCVFVTGTNGKTTTTRILADAMQRAGFAPITNREGSNLLRGLATTLLSHTDTFGNLSAPANAIGVFELDEAAFLPAARGVLPRLAIITNLFRDQLDRYFEVDYVAHLWERALQLLPESSRLLLNADDPQVAYLGEHARGPVVYYGVEDVGQGRPALEHASDSRRCLRCGADLRYEVVFYGHLGHYVCPGCGWRRPRPHVAAESVTLGGLDGSDAQIVSPWGKHSVHVPLPGLYNVYNGLAAAAAAFSLGAGEPAVTEAVSQTRSAFGRLEWFDLDRKQVCLALVKNPSGFNETLRLLVADPRPKGLLLALNDNVPDGRDVSWIWDVDLERCRERVQFVIASGLRAHDMALRLKYAGMVPNGKGAGRTTAVPSALMIESDVVEAFEAGLERTPPDNALYVLATYTALWKLRAALVRKGHLAPFWRR